MGIAMYCRLEYSLSMDSNTLYIFLVKIHFDTEFIYLILLSNRCSYILPLGEICRSSHSNQADLVIFLSKPLKKYHQYFSPAMPNILRGTRTLNVC